MNQNASSCDYISERANLSNAPDAERRLIQAVASGDERSFGELYQCFSVPLYTYLVRMVFEESAAEDLLQEVFVAIWHGACEFRNQARVKTWIFQIAHHKAVDWLRRRQKAVPLNDQVDLIGEENLENQMLEQARNDLIHTALELLTAEHREVIELVFFQEMSYTETAEVIGCPVGTVKSRISYARRNLNKSFQALGLAGNPA